MVRDDTGSSTVGSILISTTIGAHRNKTNNTKHGGSKMTEPSNATSQRQRLKINDNKADINAFPDPSIGNVPDHNQYSSVGMEVEEISSEALRNTFRKVKYNNNDNIITSRFLYPRQLPQKSFLRSSMQWTPSAIRTTIPKISIIKQPLMCLIQHTPTNCGKMTKSALSHISLDNARNRVQLKTRDQNKPLCFHVDTNDNQ